MAQGDDDRAFRPTPISALDRMLAEALELAEATKRYLARQPAIPASSPAGLTHVREIERVTSRLGHVVAWILACKAAQGGPIGERAVHAAWPSLTADPVCMAQPDVPDLPAGLKSLLGASAELYGRAIRMADGSTDLPSLH